MKILLAAVAGASGPDGVSRHAANAARSLLLHASVERVHLAIAEWQHEPMLQILGDVDDRLTISIVRTGRSGLARNLWYWTGLPILAQQLQCDVVHAAYPVPIRKRAFACPVVMTLHDLYPYDIPHNFGFPKVLLNRLILRQALKAADRIACVSASTLHRLEVYASPHVLRKAVTITNSIATRNPVATSSPIPSWRGEAFLLAVAQHRRNKNLPLTLRIFAQLRDTNAIAPDTRLVIVGAEGPETASLKRHIHRAGLVNHIILLHGISDAQLSWCYAHCEVLLATSTIEGFGLPVIEAMQQHCRVVCSDIPAFREVGGAYCSYVPLQPNPVQAFTQAVNDSLHNHRFRTAPATGSSPSSVGNACVRLYQSLLEPHTVGKPSASGTPAPAFERGRS